MPDDFYGSTLAPNDPSLPTLRGDFDAADAACFGGSFPADGAAVTTWTNKGAGGSGVNLLFAGSGYGNGPLYRESSLGYRGLSLAVNDNRGLVAASFFQGGTITVFAVVRPTNTLTNYRVYTTTSNQSRLTLTSLSSTTMTFSGQRILLREADGWAVIGGCQAIPAPVPENRAFTNGDFLIPQANFSGAPAAGQNLIYAAGFSGSGTAVLNRLLIYAGTLTHEQMLRVGWGLMQSVGVPRRARTLVAFGNSTTEMVGTDGCWPAKVNVNHLSPGGTPCEVINLARSGATSTTLATQATLRDSVESLLRGDGRRAVSTFLWGHNNGFWNPTIQSDYETFFSGWRSNGHRSIVSPMTPYSGFAETEWLNSRAWAQASGLSFHDGVVYHHTQSWADAMTDPAANADGAWADNVHLSDNGRTLKAGLWHPEILRQFRAITARLCVPSSPGPGEVALTRPGHDDAVLPVSLYLVASGGPAPTGAETPTLTLNAAETTKTAAASSGTYDAYAWSGAGPVVSLGPLAIGGARRGAAGPDPYRSGSLGIGPGLGPRAIG